MFKHAQTIARHYFKGTPLHEIPKGLRSFDLNAWIIFTIPVMGSLFTGS